MRHLVGLSIALALASGTIGTGGSLSAQQPTEIKTASEAWTSEELENLRNRQHTAALAVANHEKDLERSTERVKRIGEVRESRVAERSDLLGEQESAGDELNRLAQQLCERRTERDASQRAVDAVGLQISAAGRDLSRCESRVAELRVAYRARDEHRLRLRETATRAEQSERETRSWIERRHQEIESARNTLSPAVLPKVVCPQSTKQFRMYGVSP